MADDGWQVVRRGRRGQHTRPPSWDGYRGSGWGMARADTSSFGGRYQNPSPNQPVPFYRAPRYPGPQNQQFRSYADVARPRYQRPARRWGSPRARDPGVQREAAEPAFGRLIRKVYGVIKLVHHLQNVSLKPGTQPPAMIAKMVDILGDMIKPAYPTQQTRDLVLGNAKNWGYTTRQILVEHYETQLENFLGELSGMDTREWKSAFGVAVRWAKGNLPRITQTVLDHAEAHIMAELDKDGGQDPPPGVDSLTGRDQGTGTEDLACDQGRQPTAAAVQPRAERRPPSKVTVATMTDQPEPDLAEVPSQVEPPLERRGPRRSSQRGRKGVTFAEKSPSQDLIMLDDWVQEDMDVSPERRQVAEELDYLEAHPEENEPFRGWDTRAQWTQDASAIQKEAPKTSSTVVGVQAHQETEDEGEEDDEGEESWGGSEDEDSGPEQTEGSRPDQAGSGVHRHPRTNRKDRDWRLKVREKLLVIGDSNLSNIPGHSIKNLQIESFPGANFRHAENLVKKSTTVQGLVVEQVVLAFGICDSKNKPKETILKSCLKARKACMERFPYATIWVPLVNFSAALSEEEQDNLEVFNGLLEERQFHIPLLPEDKFRTVDPVHWTRDTGRAMLDHWARKLNFYTP